MTRISLKKLAETLYLTHDIEFRTSSLTASAQLNGHRESYEYVADAIAYSNGDMTMHLVETVNAESNTSRVDATIFNLGDCVADSSYTTSFELADMIRAFTAN